MQGCRKEKKFCAFEQSLARYQTDTLPFGGINPATQCKLFSAKRLSVNLTLNQTPFKIAEFFSKNNLTAKKLYFVSIILLTLLKAQHLNKSYIPRKLDRFY